MLQGFFVFVVFVCKRNVVNVILCRDVADESSKENEVAMQSLRENWNCRLYQQICSWSFSELWSIFQSPIPTQMAFTGVTYAHGSSPQPTACRSLSCSLMTVTGSNQALRQDLTYLAWEVWGGCGEQSFGMSDLSYFLWKVSVIQLIWRGTLSCSTIQPTQIHNKYFGHNWQKCKYIRGPFEKVSCKSNFNKTSEWAFLVLWFKISQYFMT